MCPKGHGAVQPTFPYFWLGITKRDVWSIDHTAQPIDERSLGIITQSSSPNRSISLRSSVETICIGLHLLLAFSLSSHNCNRETPSFPPKAKFPSGVVKTVVAELTDVVVAEPLFICAGSDNPNNAIPERETIRAAL